MKDAFPDLVVGLPVIAEILDLHQESVRHFWKRGLLPVTKVDGRYYANRGSLLAAKKHARYRTHPQRAVDGAAGVAAREAKRAREMEPAE
jgi:hypothetical protein